MDVVITVNASDGLPQPFRGESPLDHLYRCLNAEINKVLSTYPRYDKSNADWLNNVADACLHQWVALRGYHVENMPKADAHGYRRENILRQKQFDSSGDAEGATYYSGGLPVARGEFFNDLVLEGIRDRRVNNSVECKMDVDFIDQDGNIYTFDARWNTGFGL